MRTLIKYIQKDSNKMILYTFYIQNILICILNLLHYNKLSVIQINIPRGIISIIFILSCIFNLYIIDKYDRNTKELKKIIQNLEIVNEEKEGCIQKLEDNNKQIYTMLNKIESEFNDEIIKAYQLTLDDIFKLYQAALEIRKYRIAKYYIDPKTREIHVYCNMSTYTKINIAKEILDYMKYHIDGTDVIL